MEDTEVEEGEACSYQYDERTNIDLDALTYIDEKLQNVLGHLKKDFEGGVTSDNLGAKYGGYGSFLTQPSPIWSSSKCPANGQNNHFHKSATCLSAEDDNYSSLSRPNGNHSTKHGSGSVRSASSDPSKAPSEHDSVRQIARVPFKHSTVYSTTKPEAVDKSTSMNEQKTLKVRIKVGSDNLSTKKSSAIYSGLGLVSPSSSFGDRPIGSEDLSEGFRFPVDESPTHIIRIMTSFPIYGGHLLSPLPEGLERLTEKLLRGNKVHSHDNSVLVSNQKAARILSEEESLMSEERDHLSPKFKEDTEKSQDDVNITMSNQAELNTEDCEVLVSEAMKLPLLSDLHGLSGGKRGTSKQRSNLFSNVVKHEPLIPVLSCDMKQVGEENFAGKVADEEKVHKQTQFRTHPKKDGDNRGEATNISSDANADDFGSKSRKGSMSELSSSQKQKSGKKHATGQQEEKKLLSGREQLPTVDKKKHKGSHFIGTAATDIHRESIRNAVSRNKVSYTATGTFAKQVAIIKNRDKYRDFFGDMIKGGDGLIDAPNEPSNGRLKTSQMHDQVFLPCHNISRERIDNGTHEQPVSEKKSERAVYFDPPSGHLPSIGDRASAGAPVEDWVQCDKCLKWRLLPFGTKVDSLPEKWLCGMLNWLPGMNSCNISEEETTKAVTEVYQPQNRNGLHGSLAAAVPEVTAASDLHLTQTRREIIPDGGKKHHGLKEMPDSKPESLHSVKRTSLTISVGSHLPNERHFQHLREPNDRVSETDQRKNKSKKNKLDSFSDGGHSKDTKLGCQRELDHDSAKAKKLKTEHEDWMFTRDVGNEMLIPNSSNELQTNGTQKGLLTNHASASQSSKVHTVDSLQDSIKISKFQVQAMTHADCMDRRNPNDGNVDTKKRKVKSSVGAVIPSFLSDNAVNESEQTEQKKARMSLLEEKASSSSQGNGRIEKRRKRSKDHRVGKDGGSTSILDDGRSLKRELWSGATPGPSKVMDSQKSKSILREVKSSPVESISLSLSRNTNLDMFALREKNLPQKDCSHISGPFGILTADDSKRFADTEDNSGGEKCGAMRKNLCANEDQIDGCLVDDKVQIKHSLDPSSDNIADIEVDTFDQQSLCTSEAPFNDVNQPVKSFCDDKANGSLSKHSAGASSWPKDKNQKFKPESDKSRVKISESYDDSRGYQYTLKDKTRDIKIKFQEKSERNSGELDFGGKKKPSAIMLDNATKENGKLKSDSQEDSLVKADSTRNHEMGSNAKNQVHIDCGEKISKSADQVKNEEMELLSGKEKSGNKGDLSNHVSFPNQDNGAEASCGDVHDKGKGLKEHNSTKKPDIQNGGHSSTSKHQSSIVHRLKDRNAPSPMRRDSHNQAASNALREGKDLKHLADRKKNSGSTESTGLYFEAALKFLHGACLLESCGSENSKRGDIIQSMQVYSSTAKLFEFCAHEYEKSKDLASASLAYKCMEVAYLRVIYSSHPAASRDRLELQNSLQMGLPGESPSSSASDIDNASNLAAAEKAPQAKDGNSPQPAGNHVIAAKSRPSFSRLLSFMQDVNSAMEASRKSQGAFAAAKVTMKQTDSKEGITSIKRVLDFNFHDVNGLLRLVRLAMEAIKH